LFEFDPEVILSDFSMHGFNGIAALGLARDITPDTPFLFVSGTLGEEHAIHALKNGATDYVLKTNLIRLPAAVTRALGDAASARRGAKCNRASTRCTSACTRCSKRCPMPCGRFRCASGKLIYMSPAACVVLGRPLEEFAADVELRRRIVHPADLARVEQAWAALRAGKRLRDRVPHRVPGRQRALDPGARAARVRSQRDSAAARRDHRGHH
jgi:PAS domain-containing protein